MNKKNERMGEWEDDIFTNPFENLDEDTPPTPKPRELKSKDEDTPRPLEEIKQMTEKTIWGAIDWSNQNNAKLVKMLLKHKGDPNATDENGIPAVGLAVKAHSPLALSYLIKAGADVNVMYTEGGKTTTPLQEALNPGQYLYGTKDSLKVVKLLIDAGAEFDERATKLYNELWDPPLEPWQEQSFSWLREREQTRKAYTAISGFINKKLKIDKKTKTGIKMTRAIDLLSSKKQR